MTIYRALRRCEHELNEAELEPAMASLTLPYPTTVGIVRGGVWASNVMEQLTAEIRVGVTVHESVAEAEHRFERTLRDAIVGDEWLDAHPPSINRTGAAFGSSSVDPDNSLVDAIQGAARGLTGRTPETIGVPYGCDMALWVREGNAMSVVYGPGDVSHAHAPDEHIHISEAGEVAAVLVHAVRRLQATT
jgi:acetylornithine deacetylase